MKLKTLKDLTEYSLLSGKIKESDITKLGKHFEKDVGFSKKDLKQEAIAKIKYLKNKKHPKYLINKD